MTILKNHQLLDYIEFHPYRIADIWKLDHHEVLNAFLYSTVISNDRLDYFVRTVNIAARIQGLSGGKDIMLSQELYSEPGIKSLINTYQWEIDEIQATLKGIQGYYDIIHLTSKW
ncbi:MAG: hypothetical protein MJB14_06555 [Spirochaetes bacterium]|nr:hypothetical protein [Spirochaetota bacterium]